MIRRAVLSPTSDCYNNNNALLITPNTLFICYDPKIGGYDKCGFKDAKSIDVLREACANWYYETTTNSNEQVVNGKQQQGKVNGPILVRELAQLFYNDMSDDDNKKKDAVMITEDTRVWLDDLGGSGDNNNNQKWNCLKDVDNLKKAIEAF